MEHEKLFDYNNINCELEKDLFLHEYGYEDFSKRESFDFFHKKSYHSFHFVLKGNGIYNIEDSQYQINPNDMFYIPPNVPIKYCHTKHSPYLYYWITLSGKKIDEILNTISVSQNKPIISLINPDKYFDTLNSLFVSPRSLYKIKSCVYLILHLLCTHEGFSCTMPVNSGFSIEAVLNYILTNYPQTDFQIESLTSIFNLSQSNLYRLFKEAAGVSPKKFLINCRMQKAYELLLQGQNVDRTAYSVGYSDIYHFSKQFKKIYNVSPSKIKKMQIKK